MSVGKFTGRGGVVWDMDIPFGEVFLNQLLSGDLEPADRAAEDYLASLRPTPEPEPVPVEVAEPEAVEVPAGRPPEAGPGSSRKAWAAYAAEQGVEVSDDDARDDIIARLPK